MIDLAVKALISLAADCRSGGGVHLTKEHGRKIAVAIDNVLARLETAEAKPTTPPAPAAVDGQRVKDVVMPEEPDNIITDAIRKAWRETRTSGVSGMTIDAQWRAEFARELAVYSAIRACLATDKEGA